ncbi:hypothetical protein QE152_g36592 [Popillia japonica]|uniref:Uncharacterized protein n=1 Tax=Popillia japonica TaxID=7064 RepID=A0AAW1IC58_POPJA
MILDLKLKITADDPSLCSSNFLLQGVQSKIYVPVMKRQRCESLEDKIKSFTKRKRFKRKSKDTLEFSLIK